MKSIAVYNRLSRARPVDRQVRGDSDGFVVGAASDINR
jgi:hypothetical protein